MAALLGLPDGVHLLPASGEDFVRIGLMANIPHQAVFRHIVYIRQGLSKSAIFPLEIYRRRAGLTQQKFGKLCIFGSYEDSELYSRNRVLVEALALNCSELIEVRPGPRRQTANNQKRLSSLGRLLQTGLGMVGNFFSLARQREKLKGADCYYVPYPAYIDLLFLRFLTWGNRRRVVVVDAFLCLHDTLVLDRKMIAQNGVVARLVSWLERQTLSRADLVFIDTLQQKKILVEQYALDESRVAVIPVGIDEAIWTPAPERPLEDIFSVLFWGTFIPLHGVDTIIKAAGLLQTSHPRISFTLIGDGQTADSISAELDNTGGTNINWVRGFISASELRQYVDESHCVLGVFGPSGKAGNVIPYKGYQAMACNKILISRSGPAFAELLHGREKPPGLLLVPAADPGALAQSIAAVYEAYNEIQPVLNTREFYDCNLSNSVIRKRVTSSLGIL